MDRRDPVLPLYRNWGGDRDRPELAGYDESFTTPFARCYLQSEVRSCRGQSDFKAPASVWRQGNASNGTNQRRFGRLRDERPNVGQFRTRCYVRFVVTVWRRATYVRTRTDPRWHRVISFFGILRSRARERESNAPEQRHPNDQFPVSQHTKGSDRFASSSSAGIINRTRAVTQEPEYPDGIVGPAEANR